MRRSDDQLHLLCQVEIFLLLLCAYSTMNDVNFYTPGSSIDILLSAVLIILTGGLFVYVFVSLLWFVRSQYYSMMRQLIKANANASANSNATSSRAEPLPGSTTDHNAEATPAAELSDNSEAQPKSAVDRDDAGVEMTSD